MTTTSPERCHSLDASSAASPLFDERLRLRATLTRALPEIPPIYFYDDRGSALFEEITGLSVYYQTRTEIGLLERHGAEIVAAARPRHLVELGSGAGRKIRILLDAWRAAGIGETCTMLDVNESFVEESLRRLRADYPGYAFRGQIGDFTRDLARLGAGGERLTIFLGGTLGNLYPEERRRFFQSLSRGMEASDAVLLGVDLIKDPARLEAAYDDPEGVTAAFNRNALRTLNHRFGADFDVGSFTHRAFYDAEHAWIEMRLRAERAMRVSIPALDLTLKLERGAEIRTEVSCKFTRDSLAIAAAMGGLSISHWYTDPEELFALALLRKTDA
jgi:L-histidine N-alpha-methyltransferase